MSAESAGVDLVPLFDAAPVAVRRRSSVDVPQFHFAIQLLSRISRNGSASHHTAKFADGGDAEIRWPRTSTRPAAATLVQNSLPGKRGSMSADRPRPTSAPGRMLQMIWPVRAS